MLAEWTTEQPSHLANEQREFVQLTTALRVHKKRAGDRFRKREREGSSDKIPGRLRTCRPDGKSRQP